MGKKLDRFLSAPPDKTDSFYTYFFEFTNNFNRQFWTKKLGRSERSDKYELFVNLVCGFFEYDYFEVPNSNKTGHETKLKLKRAIIRLNSDSTRPLAVLYSDHYQFFKSHPIPFIDRLESFLENFYTDLLEGKPIDKLVGKYKFLQSKQVEIYDLNPDQKFPNAYMFLCHANRVLQENKHSYQEVEKYFIKVGTAQFKEAFSSKNAKMMLEKLKETGLSSVDRAKAIKIKSML